jgi:alpha-tubulin suppressor-like RCC1 family protein
MSHCPGRSAACLVASLAAGSAVAQEAGVIRGWGRSSFGQCVAPPGLKHLIEVCAGGQHVVALRRDGRIFAWGYNAYGQCEVPRQVGPVAQVAAGINHSGVLRTDGSVLLWGGNTYGESTTPVGLPVVRQLALGSQRTVVLLDDGSVRCWGRGDSGSCNVPADLPPVELVRSTGWLTYALCSDGSVRGWGLGAFPYSAPPGTVDFVVSGQGIVSIDMAGSLSCAWPASSSICPLPPTIGTATSISEGISFMLAQRPDGTLMAWGEDLYGQLSVPSNLPRVIRVDGGDDFAVVIVEDPCPADLNSNDLVDGDDLAKLLSEWGGIGDYRAADFNLDGFVDGVDLGILLAAWGSCPS